MQSPRVRSLINQLIHLSHHPIKLPLPTFGIGSTNRTSFLRTSVQIRAISSSSVFWSYYDSPQSTTLQPLTPSPQVTKQARRKASEDPFIQQICEVRNLTEATDFIEKNADIIEIRGIIAAVDVLFDLLREEKSPAIRKEILYSVGSQKLFKCLRRSGRHMDAGDLISAVKLLTILGASGSDVTFQVMLKLLTKHANTLDLHQIFYLQFLLGKMTDESKSALSGALEYALPIVFESQLNTQLDLDNLQSLCDFLHYASKHGLSDKAIQKLVESILRSTEKMTPRQAMSILWSIGDLKKEAEYQEPLVAVCFKHVTNSIDSLKLEELNTLIVKSAKKYMKKVKYFYDEDFVQAYCNKLMSRYVSPDQTLYSFRSVSALKHVHVEYMDRVGELIASDPSEVLNSDFLFLSLVRSFSGCNYKPEKWTKFEALFLDHPALTKDLGFQDINLALDFLALDTYPDRMIHKIYSPEELPRLDVFLHRNAYTSASTLVLLYNAVKILHPQYSGPLPPISMIEKWKDIAKHTNSKKNYMLKNALQTGFGGENYVINGVYHDGLHIDHAIVLRKGGFAIAMNSQPTLQQDGLTDIQKPAESVIVLVKVFYKEAYSNNTNRLRGIPALEQKIIENLGHPVVALDAERWTELPDYEKIPFLMQRIKEKIEKFQWNQSSSDVIPQ